LFSAAKTNSTRQKKKKKKEKRKKKEGKMPSPSNLKPYFFFVCVLNGNNVNECEPLGEL
jgi:hypothetical protein